jgi:hypothetical protein
MIVVLAQITTDENTLARHISDGKVDNSAFAWAGELFIVSGYVLFYHLKSILNF